MADPVRGEYVPNPYTPNLSGITVGKPIALSGIGVFVSYTISLLHEFGLPLTPGQQEALETWINQAEIFLLPLITYALMKRNFNATATDLLHQHPPPTTPATPPPPADPAAQNDAG